jgi:hypothetical protein
MTGSVETNKSPATLTGCACEQAGASYRQFESRDLGCDETEGRFAEVTLDRCRTCGRLWLHYLVEYEAFSRSGRWARGLISDESARTIRPEAAVPYLNGLDWYLYGGSYFDGIAGRRCGPMRWGP